MTVKIFVLGDSFCYHDDIPVMQSWPALISQNSDYTIYNGAAPGSSNDSLFYRYLQMEEQFGKPDCTLVQLTYMCRVWLPIQDEYILHPQPYTPRYWVTPKPKYKNTTVTFAGFGDAAWERRFEGYSGVPMQQLKPFYDVQSAFHIQEWRTRKETLLLNSYGNRCLFWSWDIDFAPFMQQWSVDYMGSIHQIHPGYSTYWQTPTDNHYTEQGHAALAPMMLNKINQFLNK